MSEENNKVEEIDVENKTEEQSGGQIVEIQQPGWGKRILKGAVGVVTGVALFFGGFFLGKKSNDDDNDDSGESEGPKED